jgi:hypothetical protein
MKTLLALILFAFYCWLWRKSHQALMKGVRQDVKAVGDQAFEPLLRDLATLQKKIEGYEAGHRQFQQKALWGTKPAS